MSSSELKCRSSLLWNEPFESELYAGLLPSSNAGLHPSSNDGQHPRCHNYLGLQKIERIQPSLMPEMPYMEPATGARALCRTAFEVVHHPDCGLIFCEYFQLVQFILCRDI